MTLEERIEQFIRELESDAQFDDLRVTWTISEQRRSIVRRLRYLLAPQEIAA